MNERPILVRKAQGCFRAGVPRPWRFKGGRKAAQDRYKKSHVEERKASKRASYQRNKDKHRERSREWRRKNPEKWRAMMQVSNRNRRDMLRCEMIKAYGGACACCGETEPLFLELDHVRNNGAEDRIVNGGGAKLLGRLMKAHWPKEDYQLLCSNCNQGKRRNGGVCPHKKSEA